METVLTTSALTKHYGSIKAVNDLNLNIEKGCVFGLLGPNGSGKSTTLGMVLDVVNPTRGDYTWFGSPKRKNSRLRIGAMLEKPNFYSYLSGYSNLKIVCDIKDIPYSKIDESLKFVGLYERRHSRFSTFSTGMRQRLALASCLLNDPEVLILDEPTNGLDPQGIAEVRELIIKLSGNARTIILASHLLDEVEKVCTHVAVLKKGNLLVNGRVSELFASGNTLEISSNDLEILKTALRSIPGVKKTEQINDRITVTLSDELSSIEFHKQLIKQGIILNHLVQKKTSLEENFLQLIK